MYNYTPLVYKLPVQANAELDRAEAQVTTLAVIAASGRSFLERFWLEVLIAAAAIASAGWAASARIRIRRLRRRLRRLRLEERALRDLMKEVQRARFQTGALPESVYNIRMDRYAKRLEAARRTIPVLEAALARKARAPARRRRSRGQGFK